MLTDLPNFKLSTQIFYRSIQHIAIFNLTRLFLGTRMDWTAEETAVIDRRLGHLIKQMEYAKKQDITPWLNSEPALVRRHDNWQIVRHHVNNRIKTLRRKALKMQK